MMRKHEADQENGTAFFQNRELDDFRQMTLSSLENLYTKAKKTDEASFVFSLLGFSAGIEEYGWQPIQETFALYNDFILLAKAPLKQKTQLRILMLLYCHIIDANFIPHVLYNMLATVERLSPNIFNFLDKYRNKIPPSVPSKIEILKEKQKNLMNRI